MFLIEPHVDILTNITGEELDLIEKAARTCYKSEISDDKNKTHKFIAGLIKNGHEAMIEHSILSVKFTVDRGVSHELVRHRIASFAQESTRYCAYKEDLIFVVPYWYEKANSSSKCEFVNYLKIAEETYHDLLAAGYPAEAARSALPNCIKTEVMVTANYREWRNFFKLRALGLTGKPHPDMKKVAKELLREVQDKIPVIFDDLIPDDQIHDHYSCHL